MKAQDMKTWRNVAVSVVALLAVLFPTVGEAKGKDCESRSLSDFLDAQGTLDDPPLFFPPVKDYAGWADGKFITFALIDYAGLANNYIDDQTGQSLGTEVSGSVTECALADGTARITVSLFTSRALGFAQSLEDLANNNFDFLNTPTTFGAKAQDVVNGADAAVGPVTLFTTFSISAPGANLPDLLDVIGNPAQYAPVKVSIKSTTCGKRPDGSEARLDVHQMASTNNADELVFSVEHVKIVSAHGGKCGD
jgi:hypothetical protein